MEEMEGHSTYMYVYMSSMSTGAGTKTKHAECMYMYAGKTKHIHIMSYLTYMYIYKEQLLLIIVYAKTAWHYELVLQRDHMIIAIEKLGMGLGTRLCNYVKSFIFHNGVY